MRCARSRIASATSSSLSPAACLSATMSSTAPCREPAVERNSSAPRHVHTHWHHVRSQAQAIACRAPIEALELGMAPGTKQHEPQRAPEGRSPGPRSQIPPPPTHTHLVKLALAQQVPQVLAEDLHLGEPGAQLQALCTRRAKIERRRFGILLVAWGSITIRPLPTSEPPSA